MEDYISQDAMGPRQSGRGTKFVGGNSGSGRGRTRFEGVARKSPWEGEASGLASP